MDRFWSGVLGTIVGGIVLLWIGAKFYGVGQFQGLGGGGPQNAGATPIGGRGQIYAVYPDTQSQPAWAFPDPASDIYNAGNVTTNDAGRSGTQDYFGVPLGRRTDNATRSAVRQSIGVN